MNIPGADISQTQHLYQRVMFSFGFGGDEDNALQEMGYTHRSNRFSTSSRPIR
jgi:hypothetical protein